MYRRFPPSEERVKSWILYTIFSQYTIGIKTKDIPPFSTEQPSLHMDRVHITE
jgi:hypothetical protein